jgi:hypothetical protein
MNYWPHVDRSCRTAIVGAVMYDLDTRVFVRTHESASANGAMMKGSLPGMSYSGEVAAVEIVGILLLLPVSRRFGLTRSNVLAVSLLAELLLR